MSSPKSPETLSSSFKEQRAWLGGRHAKAELFTLGTGIISQMSKQMYRSLLYRHHWQSCVTWCRLVSKPHLTKNLCGWQMKFGQVYLWILQIRMRFHISDWHTQGSGSTVSRTNNPELPIKRTGMLVDWMKKTMVVAPHRLLSYHLKENELESENTHTHNVSKTTDTNSDSSSSQPQKSDI